MVYMLDTNIVSDIIRNPNGAAAKRFNEAGDGKLCVSIIIAAELRFGVLKRASSFLAQRVKALLEELPVIPLQLPVDEYYADIRFSLERAGTPIGQNDLWIAAHALSLDHILVTDNTREFSRIQTLRIENWLR